MLSYDILNTLEELSLPPAGSVVAVAMSGGVDSSLVAYLMAERGCKVIGVTMKVYDGSIQFPEGAGNGCYGPDEVEDEAACRRLCDTLKAEYVVVDLSKSYGKEVLDYFRTEYKLGRTPNPCLRCNPLIKFGLLPQALNQLGYAFDYYVTGHYARLFAPHGNSELGVYLAPGLDPFKDQSYFLQRLGQDILVKTRFPLGVLRKDEVRQLARERGLEVAEKKDSQDFVAKEDYETLFEKDALKRGNIIDTKGRVLGEHQGIVRYTIGQRRGVGVSTGTEPLYVVALNAEKNQVVVGHEQELFSHGLEASQSVWAPGFGYEPFRALAKIRLASKPAWALVEPHKDGTVKVSFDEAQRAIAPGQSVAFYVPLPDQTASEDQIPVSGPTVGNRVPAHAILAGGAVIERKLSDIA
ncbi:tRNA 2-thiouridine(34) synthase MnmA [Gracilinema caldarium]|uniref:tRNA-specific 2-thiouridylase MnmA n=1 Tax=Gracilinema caldarium (strain ATCC 51460 / DSM 7334 / H1) TaxID=744872 RepID=F8EXG2_GRAC1|nr:tRNA 2-thiouridine(34) synthase MnmA [Gracilinema caldarium]AEJ19189.1 tRNA-specific 2-thiouridylase mnmA [Gracilinema caldarium DSM 7334]